MSDTPNPYDRVPYESFPYAQSHPDRLSVVATLFGIHPRPTDDCRVLELGCAGGGNLIPMATALPRSRFVGVDYSSRQIERAQEIVARLGLSNISFVCRSIGDLTSDLGTFDYIICHGVFSWVPREIQEKILQICGEYLAPGGVAYVSYNSYPGWHLRGAVRDMMAFHSRKFERPEDQAARARELLDFLVKAVPDPNDAYGILLKKEFELLQNVSDSYLIHEHLESHNEPVYFHQFMERAEKHGLQFLAESELLSMSTHRTGSQAEEVIRGFASNVVELEQYMDFLRNRMFRQTLLCRKGVKLKQEFDPRVFESMYVACALKPRDPPVNVRDASIKSAFADPNGALETSDPRLKAALLILSECWPEALPFEKLAMRMNACLYDDPVDSTRFQNDSCSVAPSFLECYARGVMRLSLHPPVYVARPSERPVSSPVARLQAEHSPNVTNLLHQVVALNDMGRRVLRLADGSRTQDDLLEALTGFVDKGELLLQADFKPVRSSSEARPLLSQSLTRCLKKLCEDALLVG